MSKLWRKEVSHMLVDSLTKSYILTPAAGGHLVFIQTAGLAQIYHMHNQAKNIPWDW